MLMYIKIPINLLQNNPFNSVNECLFYAFCASHTKEETMSFNYSTEKLQEVFPVSSSQLTRYLNHLVDLGIAENKSLFFNYGGVKFVGKRNYKIDTSLYYDSFTYDENGKAKDYLNLNLGWVNLYGMSLVTALVLACVYSGFIYLNKPKELYFRTADISEMTGVKDRKTIYKAIDQLTVLGFITEKVSDKRYFRLIEVNEKKCLCKSKLEVYQSRHKLNYKILDTVKDKSKRFVNSVKTLIKKASKLLGDVYSQAYEKLIGNFPDSLMFRYAIDRRLLL